MDLTLFTLVMVPSVTELLGSDDPGVVAATGAWIVAAKLLGCIATSVFTFTQIDPVATLLWCMPLYGLFAIGGFGTFAAYLPELFPTRIRATGPGFCWNMGRVLTATGPLVSGMLVEAAGSVPMAALASLGARFQPLIAAP